MVSWWADWKMFGCYPYGSDNINQEPAIVYNVICLCDRLATKANSEKQDREADKLDA